MPKVLVVDDEENIVELIRYNLEREGYTVITANDGEEAYRLSRQEQPDLVILDVMLPGQDGLSVCRNLQHDQKTRHIPIIMVSARVEEVDRIVGLEMGADDYITKPFSPRELLARVKARLRRGRIVTEDEIPGPPKGRLTCGPLIIDQEKFAVTLHGVRQDFTPKEFELLFFLASEPGRDFSREYLLEHIWGYDYMGDSRTVDVHIRHIRQKLEQISGSCQFIETVRGVGYRFKEAP
jgi:two-component system alkaline phosphatase synthesis response regulator PhoP